MIDFWVKPKKAIRPTALLGTGNQLGEDETIEVRSLGLFRIPSFRPTEREEVLSS